MEKVSVIIPARNEEKFLSKTIESYRRQQYPSQIIVVANGCRDGTYAIAKARADVALHFPEAMGVCRAKNEGAKAATGGIFIFSDADTYLTPGGVEKIAQVTGPNTITVVLGKPGDGDFRGKLFFFYKNLGHRLGLYKSVPYGLIACHRDIFFKLHGFDEQKKIAEYADFIRRSKKYGAKYVLVTDCYAVTSLRRFEKNGYLKEYLFWIRWRIASFFKKGSRLEDEYFNGR